MGTTLIVILVIVVVLGLIFAGLYNGLVKLRNVVQESWAQIDVELKRRHDLIGNLVETVKGYAAHERGTLDEVTQARARAMAPNQSPAQAAQSEGELSKALVNLQAVSEAYPDLKANQNFLALQEELTATEGRVAYARQFYNDSVLDYNNKLQQFPTIIFARILKFERREYFEADEAARTVPTVQF
jgi:LemA protein